MKACLPALLALTLSFEAAGAAGPYIELDLDGTLGNGPDHQIAQIGDTIQVDAWVMPAVPLTGYHAVGFVIRGINASLLSYAYKLLWTNQPIEDLGDGGWYVLSVTFDFVVYLPPLLHGSARFLYHGPGPGRVVISEPTFWFSYDFETGLFTNNIPARFGPTTATEESSWSLVKELFR